MIDPEVLRLAREYLAKSPTSRAAKAIRLLIDKGGVTTGELNRLGYDHPPRAIADVRDLGLPVRTEMIRSDGKHMARYVFGTSADIRAGQSGRTNFSKAFRTKLLAVYGSRDAITGAEHPTGSLQIDHRVPYRIAGDAGLETDDVKSFMLLDGKSQRAKSWACEHCNNFKELHQAAICVTCFWAHPEDYDHVAMSPIRRVDIVWQGEEVLSYDALKVIAVKEGKTVSGLLKQLGREAIKLGK